MSKKCCVIHKKRKRIDFGRYVGIYILSKCGQVSSFYTIFF